MNCDVVKDLIPLYIDECCSEESRRIVEEHLAICSECKKLYERMKTPTEINASVPLKNDFSRVNQWKASLLQSVLLFASFFLITVGVALEASTPLGFTNGLWAQWLVIPSTGFMLSLANWYFVRLYKSRKAFSLCSSLITLGITVCAYIWSWFHYEFNSLSLADVLDSISFIFCYWYGFGIVLTVVFFFISKILSDKFAKLLGKE